MFKNQLELGGMTNKKWGRIGDSPIIGAGTYANNSTCGISFIEELLIILLKQSNQFNKLEY